MQDIIRNGLISSVNSENGTVRVYYPDRGSTTTDFPIFSFNGEYKPPKVGDQVIVLHFSNDISSGIVLGRFWDAVKPPGNAEFNKEIGEGAYETFLQGTYSICAPEINLVCAGGSMTVSELLGLRERVEALERRE